MKGALILGGDFQALGVLRSLARCGVRVCIADNDISICRYSKYLYKRFFVPGLRDASRFMEAMINLAFREGLEGWVLFPNDDYTIKLIAENHEELSRCYKLTVPPWSVARKYYYKDVTAKIAQDLGIPTPRTYNHDEVLSDRGQPPRYPLVLKPVCKEGYFDVTGKKAVLVQNREELLRELPMMCSIVSPDQIIVQDFIRGGTQNLYSYGCVFDGETSLAGLSARRLRQHPPDFGRATTYAVSANIPILEEYACVLLKAIGFYGMAEVEFMWDEDSSQYKLLEVNGRPWGWHTLAKGLGLELPYILFRFMQDQPAERVVPERQAKWVRLVTDSAVSISEIFRGNLRVSDWLNSYRGGKQFAVFAADDPLPFVMELVLLPYFFLKKGF